MTIGSVQKININPPLGIEFIGYHRDKPISEILHDIYAISYYIKSSQKEMLFISIDNVGLLKEFSDEIRNRISEATNIEIENIILNFSHTHSGPATADGKEITIKYNNELVNKLVEISIKCIETAQPIEISWNLDEIEVSDNRREIVNGIATMGIRKDVRIDNRIAYLNIRNKANKENLGLLIFMSSHPNILKSDSFVLSNDYISVVREKLSNESANIAIVQLGTGNLNPKWRGSVNDLNTIADKVERSFRTQEFIYEVIESFEIYNKKYDINLMKISDIDKLNERAKYASEVWELNTEKWKDAMISRMNETLSLEFEISGFKLNNGIFMGIPFEPFYEMSLEIKNLLGNDLILFGGYTNGYYGYLPYETEYQFSGYEVDINPVVYGPLTGLWMPVTIEESKNVADNVIKIIKNNGVNY